MSENIQPYIKKALFILSALTAVYGIITAFWDIKALITLLLISALFVVISFNIPKHSSKNLKSALFLAAAAIAFFGVLFAFANATIGVTLFFISGLLILAALNVEAFNIKQTAVSVVLFFILFFISVKLYQNPSLVTAWIALIVFTAIAVFANKINVILFLILFFILVALYQNQNHSLVWVSLIIFTIITALTNKIGYQKSNPKLPGFGISLGLSLTYMSFLILIPLSALVLYSTQMPWEKFLETLTDPRITTALKISFGASFTAAIINCFFGLIIAWVLTRYDFWGKRIVDSVIDLPFAVPTAVAGISLAYIFSPNGILGEFLQLLTDKLHLLSPYFGFLETVDLNVAYSKIGIVIALVFIGLPFIVRTVQPVIEELDKELEEAASSLGA
ncbi:MAG: ABC transporter permease subunit, partial [Campylobacteraceae bacterium]|nr:ABC transporter permease subunit [Campylobacteraceae bacterium]